MSENKIPYKIYLDESEIPSAWYNLRADMKNKPAPLLDPGTHKPLNAEQLGVVFCDYSLYRNTAGNKRFLQDVPSVTACSCILS